MLKMCQRCVNPFSFKHMKRGLLDRSGGMKCKPNIITFRSTASYIVKKFHSLRKTEYP